MKQTVSEINNKWRESNLKQLLLETAHPSWLPVLKSANLVDKLNEIDSFINQELQTYGTAMAILPDSKNR